MSGGGLFGFLEICLFISTLDFFFVCVWGFFCPSFVLYLPQLFPVARHILEMPG